MKYLKLFIALFLLSATFNTNGQTISGTLSLCNGTPSTLSGTPAGGTWTTSAGTGVVVIGGTGIVTGVADGTATISYNSGSGVATAVVTVNALPPAITGPLGVCVGSSTTLADAMAGGTWVTSTPGVFTVGLTTGVVTGIAAGTATVSYIISATSCYTSRVMTVNAPPSAITGPTTVCVGSTATLSSTPTGGVWTSSAPGVAVMASSTGIMTGITAGTATITYYLATCVSSMIVTVNPIPDTISGPTTICLYGSPVTFSNTTPGGTWASMFLSVATISSAGVVTPISGGVTTISYTLSTGCRATKAVAVDMGPTVSVTATPSSCGDTYLGVATGATTIAWTPATGVACTTCATTNINPTATTTYTVIGTTAGCTGAPVTVTVFGDRILGHISFSSSTPSALAMKVWLIQFNPIDSSIVATDSMATCLDVGMPYYQFDSKPAGNYMVKAKLLSSVAGTSDYIPTYGASTPNWYAAASIAHTAGTDVQNINMIYGTVPAGPGFITGYVYSGAGKGTSGEVPEAGMLVYLKNPTTGQVITYTYTDAAGAYSFSGLAYGDYMIFPEEFDNYTTPTIVTLSASTPWVGGVGFRKSTTSHTIYPFMFPDGVEKVSSKEGLCVFPNPSNGKLNIEWNGKLLGTANVVITDVTGREVYKTEVNNANTIMDISKLQNGLYFISVKSAEINYSAKFMAQQ